MNSAINLSYLASDSLLCLSLISSMLIVTLPGVSDYDNLASLLFCRNRGHRWRVPRALDQPYQILSASPLSPCPPLQSPWEMLQTLASLKAQTLFFLFSLKLSIADWCLLLLPFWGNLLGQCPSIPSQPSYDVLETQGGTQLGVGTAAAPWSFYSNMGKKLMKKPKNVALEHLKGLYIHTIACASKWEFWWHASFFTMDIFFF